MTGNRAGRVFGRLLLTTCRVYDGAPLLDGARVRDAEGRRYGALVFGRGRWALVIGWRDAPVPTPARWRPRFLLACARSALLLAVLRAVNALLVRVGLAIVVLPVQPVVLRGPGYKLGDVMHVTVDPARTADDLARRLRFTDRPMEGQRG